MGKVAILKTIGAMGVSVLMIGMVGCVSSDKSIDVSSDKGQQLTPTLSLSIVPFVVDKSESMVDMSSLPMREINTPYGIRVIPDQKKNPDFLHALKTLKKLKKNNKGDEYYAFREEYRRPANFVQSIINIHYHDILRLGCLEYTNAQCQHNGIYYKSDCFSQHNFGKNFQSNCEKQNSVAILRHPVARSQCEILGEIRQVTEMHTNEPPSAQLESILSFECTQWRAPASTE